MRTEHDIEKKIEQLERELRKEISSDGVLGRVCWINALKWVMEE